MVRFNDFLLYYVVLHSITSSFLLLITYSFIVPSCSLSLSLFATLHQLSSPLPLPSSPLSDFPIHTYRHKHVNILSFYFPSYALSHLLLSSPIHTHSSFSLFHHVHTHTTTQHMPLGLMRYCAANKISWLFYGLSWWDSDRDCWKRKASSDPERKGKKREGIKWKRDEEEQWRGRGAKRKRSEGERECRGSGVKR